MWKKKGESLKRHCTVKGKKESVSEHIVYFNVAVVHDKGVLRCLLCFGNINSETCKSCKLFLQDSDPSQNSKIACGSGFCWLQVIQDSTSFPGLKSH